MPLGVPFDVVMSISTLLTLDDGSSSRYTPLNLWSFVDGRGGEMDGSTT